MNISQQIFECCKEMNRLGFQPRHNDDSYFYIRPDMLVRMDETDLIRDVNKHCYIHFDDLIYRPDLEHLIEELQPNNIDFSVTNGVYVSTVYGNQEFRTNSETLWLALAGNWISIKKQKDSEIPLIDLETLPINKTDI